jgi:hypothetical protein
MNRHSGRLLVGLAAAATFVMAAATYAGPKDHVYLTYRDSGMFGGGTAVFVVNEGERPVMVTIRRSPGYMGGSRSEFAKKRVDPAEEVGLGPTESGGGVGGGERVRVTYTIVGA